MILDSDIFIGYLRDYPPAVDYILKNKKEIFYNDLIEGELLRGCKNKKEEKVLDEFLSKFKKHKIKPGVTNLGLSIFKRHFLKDGIGFLDALIAASAILENQILVTKKIKHFVKIKEIEIIKPY